MAEIDFENEWYETMINLAASDDRLRNLASWFLGQKGEYSDSEAKYEHMARAACVYYGLDPDEDLDIVMDLCEERLLKEVNDG